MCLWPDCTQIVREGDFFCRTRVCRGQRKAAGERGLTHQEYEAWGVWADYQKERQRSKNQNKDRFTRYRQSDKGRSTRQKAETTEAARRRHERYEASPQGKATRDAYRRSERGLRARERTEVNYRERRARTDRKRYYDGVQSYDRMLVRNDRLRKERWDEAVKSASVEVQQLLSDKDPSLFGMVRLDEVFDSSNGGWYDVLSGENILGLQPWGGYATLVE